MSTTNQPNIPPAAYCRQCGKPLTAEEKRDVRGMIFCEDCLTAVVAGNTRTPPPPQYAAPLSASPVLAAFLAWIPGVGAMYNGQFAKGFAHVVVTASLIAMQAHFASSSSAVGAEIFLGLTLTGFWFYMVIDAYQTARARQMGLPLPDPFGLNSFLGGTGTATNQTAAMGVPPQQVPYSYPPPQYQAPVSVEPAPRCDRQPIGAFVLIGLGFFFLLEQFHAIHELIGRLFWPLFLIGLGVWIAMRRLEGMHKVAPSEGKPEDTSTTEISITDKSNKAQ